MFVSDKLKLVFVHIPKTSGASVTRMIKAKYDTSAYQVDLMHCPMNREYVEQYKDYHKFTIVRNSWETCASCYRFEMLELTKKNLGTQVVSFEDWLIQKRLVSDSDIQPPQPFPRQLDYVQDDKGLMVDSICVYDRVEEDLSSVFQEIGVDFNPSVYQQFNAHYYGKYDFSKYYQDEKMIKLVADICENDIQYFKFEYKV